MIAHTVPHFHRWHDPLLLGYHLLSCGLFDGLGEVFFLGQPMDAFVAWRRVITICSHSMLKTAEKTARNLPSEIDTRTLCGRSNDDDELERFFAGLPGFRDSKVVSNPLPSLTGLQN